MGFYDQWYPRKRGFYHQWCLRKLRGGGQFSAPSLYGLSPGSIGLRIEDYLASVCSLFCSSSNSRPEVLFLVLFVFLSLAVLFLVLFIFLLSSRSIVPCSVHLPTLVQKYCSSFCLSSYLSSSTVPYSVHLPTLVQKYCFSFRLYLPISLEVLFLVPFIFLLSSGRTFPRSVHLLSLV